MKIVRLIIHCQVGCETVSEALDISIFSETLFGIYFTLCMMKMYMANGACFCDVYQI